MQRKGKKAISQTNTEYLGRCLICLLVLAIFWPISTYGQEPGFDGLSMSLGSLARLSHAKTRSVSPENFTGEKGKAGMATEGTGAGAARELGQGWKISPSIKIEPGECREIANIDGPGAIQQIWMTPTGHWRHDIL
ncbi:MAG: hypothetical protein MUO33_02970, partial [Sedimentisphaerales bacterium]|nr:hypothetical protein [Sedimentisphaerales bacterium]